MTNTQHESHRELGENGQVFVEKLMGCYREVNTQTYPLNPYLLHLIVRQISNKVKQNMVPAFHPSWLGFLCILGCFETKNVGRTTMMVRDTAVSTCDGLDSVFHNPHEAKIWKLLNLKTSHPPKKTWVVVNEACIAVTRKCFDAINLLQLKQKLKHVECFERGRFICIRYKVGLFFKRLLDTDVWVTPRDELYWSKRLLGIETKEELVERYGYDYVTSYHVDLNPFFQHNSFPKNILAFNALKNAVLATDSHYARYFMDTISAYGILSEYHKVVLLPADDDVSHRFVLRVPRITVAYASFLGCTQEDCIVRRKDVNAFDCCRFYTLRVKIEADGPLKFHPVQGDPDDTTLLGNLVNHGTQPLKIEPFSIHLRIVDISPREKCMHFTKTPFRVLQYVLTRTWFNVSVEQKHKSSTGDKLCSFHGQKGVMRVVESLPVLDEKIQPDLLVNPYSLFRMTPGQILEGIHLGNGRDAQIVRNSDGEIVPGAKAFYAKTFYFPIAYWSSEHLYAPRECVLDKLLGQAVKGRSRGGGMRIGNMEILNGLRGNGLASCFEEKFFEHGDRIPTKEDVTIALPKAVDLVRQDARFFKCDIEYETESSVLLF
jgi:hypothetical protein